MPKTRYPQLAQIIRQIMEQKGLTQEQIGLEIQISQGDVQNILRGGPLWERHWNTFLQLLRLCDELDLIERRPPKPNAKTQIKRD